MGATSEIGADVLGWVFFVIEDDALSDSEVIVTILCTHFKSKNQIFKLNESKGVSRRFAAPIQTYFEMIDEDDLTFRIAFLDLRKFFMQEGRTQYKFRWWIH